MTNVRCLMLVSAPADKELRQQVLDGLRPCPEYLRLERDGIELLDWSRLNPPLKLRTQLGSVRHAQIALRRLDAYDVVFSDGEPVGIPLALGMRALRVRKPHLMIGHRLTSKHKRAFFTALKSHRTITRILVHSTRQLYDTPRVLGIPAGKVAFQHYYADGAFWKPDGQEEENLVVSAGREHRDYDTLAQACSQLQANVFIGAGSVHTPKAHQHEPVRWPSSVRVGFAGYLTLRELYAKAALVAIPLVDNDFQAGVTTLLEAMAMGKAVVVSETSGQRDVVEDGVTGLTVPPGNVERLRDAIEFLLDHPQERKRLGRNAKDAFDARFTLHRYAASLVNHIREIADGSGEPIQATGRVGE